LKYNKWFPDHILDNATFIGQSHVAGVGVDNWEIKCPAGTTFVSLASHDGIPLSAVANLKCHHKDEADQDGKKKQCNFSKFFYDGYTSILDAKKMKPPRFCKEECPRMPLVDDQFLPFQVNPFHELIENEYPIDEFDVNEYSEDDYE